MITKHDPRDNYNSQPLKASWLDARNICREMCMDLVSMETQEEQKMVGNHYCILASWYKVKLIGFNEIL